MNTVDLLSEKRFRWIANIYFHLSASPNYNYNSFENIISFLEVRIGELSWGKNDQERKASKARFCKAFTTVLGLYDYQITLQEVINILSDDTLKNYSFVQKLAAAGKFTGK